MNKWTEFIAIPLIQFTLLNEETQSTNRLAWKNDNEEAQW